ncbi:MAG TPA: hypothetical protein VNT81_16220 [Vicinamibacterales bacterium]|nr:hypothetical protein [Vicinamibacterales bacterium]
MPFEDIRPIVSGLVGGVLALALGRWLSRWLPDKVNGKGAATLVHDHAVALRAGNIAAGAGLVGALVLYQWGGVADDDWRPLGVAVGLILSAPVTVVPLASWLRRQSAKEAIAAYAIKNRMPFVLLYLTSAAGVPLLVFSLLHYG